MSVASTSWLHGISARILAIAFVGVAGVLVVSGVTYLTNRSARKAADVGNTGNDLSQKVLGILLHQERFIQTGDAAIAKGIHDDLAVVDTLLAQAKDKNDDDRVAIYLKGITDSADLFESHFVKLESEVQSVNACVAKLTGHFSEAEKNLQSIVHDLSAEEAQLAFEAEDLSVEKAALRDQSSQFLGSFLASMVNIQNLLLRNDGDAFLAARKQIAEREDNLFVSVKMQIKAVNEDKYARLFSDAAKHIDESKPVRQELYDHWLARTAIEKKLKNTTSETQNLASQLVSLTNEMTRGKQELSQMISLGAVLVVAVLLVFLSTLIGRSITQPLEGAVHLSETIASGDLSQRLNLLRRDEIGRLAAALDNMSDALSEKARLADAIAAGDLTQFIRLMSDHDELGHALVQMRQNLNDTLSRAKTAASQVANGSRQLTDASQALSAGATEQAASLQEISSSLTEIGSQTKTNATNASEARQLSAATRDAANGGNEQMRELIDAMHGINDSSQEIGKIIKTIDDIAFQTNLLALNAAVEAARAGRHGKGFAVVAEEVRNLASRSARAANETGDMIAKSIDKVESGADIANRTAASLQEIVDRATKAYNLVNEIATSSGEQAQGLAEVNLGLSQVDSVTQQNTANAEETAAAAEELASQARELQDAIRHFKLRESQGMQKPAKTQTPQRKAAAPAQPTPPAHPKPASPAPGGDKVLRPEQIIALDDDEFGRY